MTETTFSRNPNLKNEALLAFSRQIPAALLASQPAEFVMVEHDTSHPTILAMMNAMNSQYALLYASLSEQDSIIGWAEKKDNGVQTHAFSQVAILPASPDIRTVLRTVSQHGAALFKTSEGHITGVAFPLDFDKPAARVYFYTWLMRLEIKMSEIAKTIEPSRWQQTERFTEKYILGVPEIQTVNDIEVKHLYFIDLYKILEKHLPGFPQEFYRQESIKPKKLGGKLNNLRNQIMHAVKPLVESREELIKMELLYQSMAELIHNLENYKHPAHPEERNA